MGRVLPTPDKSGKDPKYSFTLQEFTTIGQPTKCQMDALRTQNKIILPKFPNYNLAQRQH
jgi:hypothetical protein